MKVWLFLTDGDEGFGVEVRATRDGARACAWAWLRELWTEYGIEARMPKDLAAALAVAGTEAGQHGRIEERIVELVPQSPLVGWLQDHFRDPRPFEDGDEGYGVAGALAFYVGAYDDPFPDVDELACHLEEARGRLQEAEEGQPSAEALEAAKSIIWWEDAGEVDAAWAVMDEVLAEVPVEESRVAGLVRAGKLPEGTRP